MVQNPILFCPMVDWWENDSNNKTHEIGEVRFHVKVFVTKCEWNWKFYDCYDIVRDDAGLDLFSFTLYLAHSRIGSRNLGTKCSVLRHFCYSLPAELSRHCVLSGWTQHRALACYHSEEMKIFNISV